MNEKKLQALEHLIKSLARDDSGVSRAEWEKIRDKLKAGKQLTETQNSWYITWLPKYGKPGDPDYKQSRADADKQPPTLAEVNRYYQNVDANTRQKKINRTCGDLRIVNPKFAPGSDKIISFNYYNGTYPMHLDTK